MSNCHLFSISKMFTQTEIKENVKDDSIALIETFGFYEYFDALKKKSNVGNGVFFLGQQLY